MNPPNPSRPQVIVALDFDQTLTQTDTLATLTSSISHYHPQGSLPPFAPLVTQYLQDLSHHESTWLPHITPITGEQPTSDLLSTYLNSHRCIENASLNRISRAGILSGVTRNDLHTIGSKTNAVVLRPGAASAINGFIENGFKVVVISVNWSGDFIHGILHANGVLGGPENVEILCNDPEFDPQTGVSTGWVEPVMVVAGDKVEALMRIKEQVGTDTSEIVVVYAGDSLTDLPLLLVADVGLLVGQNADVLDWCSRLGIPFGMPRADDPGKALHRLDDWGAAASIIHQHIISKLENQQ
ncbi:HAD-like domain-containing protein [Kickxella alabastrina]|uniref:HAD-like domain-containing protein n=1 Tax=Kickxella alabastrina TaxID=61397 RepID=UPI00221F960F|nr:HAD-like domain-containing protein [Kickxella alabastrina]KAI7834148.1 HAD-like domain-containing protein [Kickxella alabastrina]